MKPAPPVHTDLILYREDGSRGGGYIVQRRRPWPLRANRLLDRDSPDAHRHLASVAAADDPAEPIPASAKLHLLDRLRSDGLCLGQQIPQRCNGELVAGPRAAA